MSLSSPINLYAERPAQARSFELQAAALGIDPASRSPLEWRVGYALLGLLLDPTEFGPPNFISLFLPTSAIASHEEMPPIEMIEPGIINVSPGCWVDNCQADFLIDAKAPRSPFAVRGALECDGFRYHDSTPQQASSDKARDRYFAERDIFTLRFASTDIHDNPIHVAREAVNILLRISTGRIPQ